MAIIAAIVWRNSGFVAVLLLAVLQTIPTELYEASSVDGASGLRRFTSIGPVIVVVIAFEPFITRGLTFSSDK